jgi:hypothetical protein
VDKVEILTNVERLKTVAIGTGYICFKKDEKQNNKYTHKNMMKVVGYL